MPYREKIAWVMLAALPLSIAGFLAFAVTQPAGALPNLPLLGAFAVAMTAQAAVVILAHVGLRMASPKEARAKPDEWDRAVAGRGAVIGYYVMMAGVIVVGIVMPFTHAGWDIVFGALVTIVAAEAARYGTIVISYRRGWRG